MTMPATALPRLVLDTNVLLDWLVFKEPAVRPVVAAIRSRALVWVACASMRRELERTLGYDNLAAWLPDREHVLASFDRFALVESTPAPLPLLRCSDPDDQVFLELAVATGARWLLTHDKALLRLARRARALGPEIMRPGLWQPVHTEA